MENEWSLDEDGVPHRKAARAILRDRLGRVLLMLGHDIDDEQHKWWFTVGGGFDDESPREGVAREVREETGLNIAVDRFIGPVVDRHACMHFFKETRHQDELFFLVDVDEEEISSIQTGCEFTELEKELIDDFRWWTVEEIRLAQSNGVTFYPAQLGELLEKWWPNWDGNIVRIYEE